MTDMNHPKAPEVCSFLSANQLHNKFKHGFILVNEGPNQSVAQLNPINYDCCIGKKSSGVIFSYAGNSTTLNR